MKTVVVGGGIVGLASAYELVKAGCEVTVVEAGKVGQGASHGNAAKIALAESAPVPAPGVLLQGIRWMLKPDSPLAIHPSLSPSYLRFMLALARNCNARSFKSGLELHLRMADDANALLDEYVAEGIDYEMHSRGVLLAFESKERLTEHCASLDVYAQFGHEPRRLEGDEVFEVEPALSDRIKFGLHFPNDRQLDPDSLTSALADALRARGANILEDTSVVDFGITGGQVSSVALSNGDRLLADAVVLAAGVSVRELAAKLSAKVPIHPGKGYSIDYTPPPVQLKTSLTLEDARVAVTPLNGFLRLAGTMEFGTHDNQVNTARVEAIRRAARENLRDWAGLEAGEQQPWAGMRPMTSDGLPTVGPLDTVSNAYVAGGHGMLGLTLGPGTGRIIADMVTGRTPNLSSDDLALVNPNRFASTLIPA